MFKGWIINQSSLMLNDPNTHSKKMKNLPHPDSVTTSKIIVDRNKVTPFAFEGVYIKRERGGQCLSFTCTHFGNHTAIQNNSTHELDIKVSLAKRSFRGFSNHRKRFIQKTVNASPLCNHLTKLNGFVFQSLIRQHADFRLEFVDVFHFCSKIRNHFLVWIPKENIQKFTHTRSSVLVFT